MRIAITGASGFIGAPLTERLTSAGHQVQRIGRAGRTGRPPDIVWDADRSLDAAPLEGVDAVIHLAGETIAQRWSDSAKRAIRDSRVNGTSLLARTLATLGQKPSVLVSISAIGIYGDRGDEALDERATTGTGFLADIARAWEGAADPARAAGIRVVCPRLGVVLHPGGGALAKMLTPFSLGVGGKIGSGTQWMSWIARSDVLAAVEFLTGATEIDGAVNVTAPTPATNAEFTAALGRALHRPAIATIPEFAIRLLYGEMGEQTVIAGQRVLPARLLAAGFGFAHPRLEEALRHEIDSDRRD